MVAKFETSTRTEYGRYGIRANTVCPGLVIPSQSSIRTAAWPANMGFGDKQIADMEKPTPLRHRPEALDIANAVAWLASDPARMLTAES